ncbi:MAG: radical SAM protein [Candidatus Nanoarchaeia archaeon]|jgi:radical SAM protein with 4Fe4S-binding SPASM domain
MIIWEIPPSAFPIQWHITIACDKKCKHCYTTDELTYQSELKKELSLNDLLNVGDRIIEFRDKYKVPVPLTITGGHPLIKEGLDILLRKMHKAGISVELLGNRSGLEDYMCLFKEINLQGYQISIDGNKDLHEYMRGKNSWDEVNFSINYLNDNEIPVDVMTTVSKLNMNHIKEISSFCANLGVRRYSFDRIVGLGNAKNLDNDLPQPLEYKKFLFDIFNHYVNLSQNSPTFFALKDQMWKPLLNDLGIFNPKKTDKIIGGCLVGVTGITILADGNVVPCRRLPINIGRLPEQSIEEIFFDSPKMNELRQFDAIEDCGPCDIMPYCRGNRCVAYSLHKDYFSPDPQCWRPKK